MRKTSIEGNRHRNVIPYINQDVSEILDEIERETNDRALMQSIYFGPTALTQIKRVIETGGSIIADTSLLANGVDETLIGNNGCKVLCFIDDAQVNMVAQQRRITRAEVAVDYGLQVPGPKLMLIGSAPAAINRIIIRRQHEPMSDVCVLAAPTGFASVIQMKERLMESDLCCIVARGKKGGVPATIAIINAILRQISKGNDQSVYPL
ncbi:MAG: hypothetical protein E7317_10100 [Clostridiales bacterium]|nr:hypothetical protein [Clostridiales bacterium]